MERRRILHRHRTIVLSHQNTPKHLRSQGAVTVDASGAIHSHGPAGGDGSKRALSLSDRRRRAHNIRRPAIQKAMTARAPVKSLKSLEPLEPNPYDQERQRFGVLASSEKKKERNNRAHTSRIPQWQAHQKKTSYTYNNPTIPRPQTTEGAIERKSRRKYHQKKKIFNYYDPGESWKSYVGKEYTWLTAEVDPQPELEPEPAKYVDPPTEENTFLESHRAFRYSTSKTANTAWDKSSIPKRMFLRETVASTNSIFQYVNRTNWPNNEQSRLAMAAFKPSAQVLPPEPTETHHKKKDKHKTISPKHEMNRLNRTNVFPQSTDYVSFPFNLEHGKGDSRNLVELARSKVKVKQTFQKAIRKLKIIKPVTYEFEPMPRMTKETKTRLMEDIIKFSDLTAMVTDPDELDKVVGLIDRHLVGLKWIYDYFVSLSGDFGAMSFEGFRSFCKLSGILVTGAKKGKGQFILTKENCGILYKKVTQQELLLAEKENKGTAKQAPKKANAVIEFDEFVFSLIELSKLGKKRQENDGLYEAVSDLFVQLFSKLKTISDDNLRSTMLLPNMQSVFDKYIKALGKLFRHVAGRPEADGSLPGIDFAEATQMLNSVGVIDAELTKVEVRVAYFMSQDYNVADVFCMRWAPFLEFIVRLAQLRFTPELDGVMVKLMTNESDEDLARKFETFCLEVLAGFL